MVTERVEPIPGHPGYFAGSGGTIYSAWKRRGPLAEIGDDLKPLKTTIAPDGRAQVSPQRKTHRVARLVLQAFVGPCPPGMEACHFPDRDPTNNRIENLRWDTAAENYADRVVHGTSNGGERNTFAVLGEDEVRSIRRRFAAGADARELAAEYGVSRSNVYMITGRKTWKDVE